MENIKLADLNLSQEESRDIILQAIKENKNNKQQSKNKERIDDIREELKDLNYKLSRSEFKKIKRNLYNIEKRNQLE